MTADFAPGHSIQTIYQRIAVHILGAVNVYRGGGLWLTRLISVKNDAVRKTGST